MATTVKTVLMDIVSKLTSSVQYLQQNVINLTAKVNSMTSGAVPQPVTNAVINRNAQDQARSCTAEAQISSAAARSA